MFSQINDKYKVKDWTKFLGLQTLSCSVTAKVKSTKLWTYFTLYAYCITVLGLNRELSASTATCMRNQCFYGCNHPAISNGVITITNIKSLWNSCPSFAQYKPTELMQQSTELFPLHCYCSWSVFHAGPPPTPIINNKSSQCFIVLGEKCWLWTDSNTVGDSCMTELSPHLTAWWLRETTLRNAFAASWLL